MPFRIGPLEIVLIIVIIVMVFGVGKLPQVGESIGKGLRMFRKGQSGEEIEEKLLKPEGKTTSRTKQAQS